MNKQRYFIQGLHCPSCAQLVERKLKEKGNFSFVRVSLAREEVVIGHESRAPNLARMNEWLRQDGYRLSEHPFKERPRLQLWLVLGLPLAVIGFFLLAESMGWTSAVNITTQSSWPAFFLFGLLAGFSSCGALVGSLVLSFSSRWSLPAAGETNSSASLLPHLWFHLGRLITYVLLGGLLGWVGSALRLSPLVSSFFALAMALVMVVLGLQMVGVRALQRLPLSFTGGIARQAAGIGKGGHILGPFMLGASTFFLPCGFTLTAQGLAVLSGNPLSGALVLGLFAIVTFVPLALISFTSARLLSNPKWRVSFLKAAGVLVLFFALFTFNNQLNALGLPSLSNLLAAPSSTGAFSTGTKVSAADLPPISDGVQVLKMKASSRGYTPNALVVRAGVPIRWEIEDIGTSGCTNAIVSRSLFRGEIDLTPGQTSVVEFTIPKPGAYKFSCWMGMIWGSIQAVQVNSP
jgi:sulfite exporter TauE/SafE/copper chaperone CopZ/plastocyanin